MGRGGPLRAAAGARAGRPRWILHDGPPYANGAHPHGHRAQQDPQGHRGEVADDAGPRRRLRPGLGLPRPADRAPGRQGARPRQGRDRRAQRDGSVEKRRRCREYAREFIDIQRAGVPAARRRSATGTTLPDDGARLRGDDRARVRPTSSGRGLVYKGLKPVHWCMHCKTALAQAEVEYEEQTTPVGLREVPARDGLAGPLPGALGGGRLRS